MADAYPTTDVPVDSVPPRDLLARIERGDPVRIFDVRAESEFEQWHLDGDGVTISNVPYYEFLDGVTDDLLDAVPGGQGPLYVVCAKGGASEYVAGLLIEAGIDAANLADGMVGWGEIYDAVPVERYDGPGTVTQYQRPSSGCLAYLVVSDGEAAVVDPLRAFTDRYVEDVRAAGADLTLALDTHIHADHISGVRALAERTDARAVIPEAAEGRGVTYDVDYDAVADGDTLTVGDATIEVIHTPGHTSGMTAYRVGNLLCTGDGLFTESVARPDLEEGDAGAPAAAARLYDTLMDRVLPLPDDTLVAPAHFSDAATPAPDDTYTVRLGDVHDRMDALSLPRDDFVDFVLADMPPRPANYEDIIATNLGQQSVDDDGVFELEQGPNNCAATQDAMTHD